MEGLRKIVKPEILFNKDKKFGSHYLENLQKELDARATKKSSILLRRAMIAHRAKQNYQLEYDRIRDLIHSKTISGDTKEMLKTRIKKLEELGAKAINNIVD